MDGGFAVASGRTVDAGSGVVGADDRVARGRAVDTGTGVRVETGDGAGAGGDGVVAAGEGGA
ncbi:hypothetical protein, partial [Actinomadura keratinilytica]|uniref:hypothetical protein n=1 Tax=Actinomadura keratinilytica TaxID=547461 RepID=UPI0031E924AE